jgi:hypothetical protein
VSIHTDIPLFNDLQKIDNDFYRGKIPEKDLWMVMERVNETNIRSWQTYSTVQSNSRCIDYVSSLCDKDGKRFLQKGSLGDGSIHFHKVLQNIAYNTNEVWVAYITKAKSPEKIPDSMIFYNAGNIETRDYPFAKDIEMFVSVTSSPGALVTTHMGIGSSLEGVVRRSKGTSVDLHSFAAKVMLLRNPQRKYMINAPVAAMEKILATALPSGLHVGTREMQSKMEKRLSVTKEQFIADIPRKKEKIEQLAKIEGNSWRVQRAKCLESIRANGSLDEQFKDYQTPYSFKLAINKETQTEEFLAFMEKHPPILSKKDGKITIFDPKSPSTPALTIDTEKDESYKWMAENTFRPGLGLHHIAIDLLALANCKSLGAV